jgi:hypothetical protein
VHGCVCVCGVCVYIYVCVCVYMCACVEQESPFRPPPVLLDVIQLTVVRAEEGQMALTSSQLLELAFLLHKVRLRCEYAPRAAISSRQV